jgi:hypothetical protein
LTGRQAKIGKIKKKDKKKGLTLVRAIYHRGAKKEGQQTTGQFVIGDYKVTTATTNHCHYKYGVNP